MTHKDQKMNIGVVIVVVSCAAAVFISVFLTKPFYSYYAPVWLYGADKVQAENITVVESTRHYIKFSNGDIIPKEKYWKLTACRGVVIMLLAIPIFIIINIIVLLLAKLFIPEIAIQIFNYYRQVFSQNNQ